MTEPTTPQTPEAATDCNIECLRDGSLRPSELLAKTPEAATPLTDKLKFQYYSEGGGWVVAVEDVEQLERELQTVTAERDELKSRTYMAMGVGELMIYGTDKSINAALNFVRDREEAVAQLATLRTQLAELHSAMAEQDRVNLELRKSLEIAEKQISELSTKVALAGRLQGLTENNLVKAHEHNDDLRHQLAESQAACEWKDNEIRLILAIAQGTDGAQWILLGRRQQVQDLCKSALSKTAGTDLLKRLADAESHASEAEKRVAYFQKERDQYFNESLTLTAELSRIQAEVKELWEDKERLDWLSKGSLVCISGPKNEALYSADIGNQDWTTHETPRQAIDAARTQPKP